MVSRSLTPEHVVTLLAATPGRVGDLTATLTPAQLITAPADGEWSARDLLAHLRSCADVWGGCMMAIIASDRPTLRAVNPLTWIKSTDYLELEFRPSLESYAAQRAELMAALEPMSSGDWLRAATVTGAGKALQRDVLFYGQWLAGHERRHLRQFAGIVNTVSG